MVGRSQVGKKKTHILVGISETSLSGGMTEQGSPFHPVLSAP